MTVLTERGNLNKETQRTQWEETEGEAKERGLKKFLPPKPSEGSNSTNNLILDFQPPELWDSKSLLFKPFQWLVLGYSTLIDEYTLHDQTSALPFQVDPELVSPLLSAFQPQSLALLCLCVHCSAPPHPNTHFSLSGPRLLILQVSLAHIIHSYHTDLFCNSTYKMF